MQPYTVPSFFESNNNIQDYLRTRRTRMSEGPVLFLGDDVNPNASSFSSSHTLKEEELNAFFELIYKRADYIYSLHNLSGPWINGNSSTPTLEVLEICKDILWKLYNLVSLNRSYPIPVLIMGPIPSGGFHIEIKITDSLVIYMSLYNDMRYEIDYSVGDIFTEYEIKDKQNSDSLPVIVGELYSSLVSQYV